MPRNWTGRSPSNEDACRSSGFDLRIAEPMRECPHGKRSLGFGRSRGVFYRKWEWRPRRNSGVVVNLRRVAKSELAGTVLDRPLAAQSCLATGLLRALSARSRADRVIFDRRSTWRIRRAAARWPPIGLSWQPRAARDVRAKD